MSKPTTGPAGNDRDRHAGVIEAHGRLADLIHLRKMLTDAEQLCPGDREMASQTLDELLREQSDRLHAELVNLGVVDP